MCQGGGIQRPIPGCPDLQAIDASVAEVEELQGGLCQVQVSGPAESDRYVHIAGQPVHVADPRTKHGFCPWATGRVVHLTGGTEPTHRAQPEGAVNAEARGGVAGVQMQRDPGASPSEALRGSGFLPCGTRSRTVGILGMVR